MKTHRNDNTGTGTLSILAIRCVLTCGKGLSSGDDETLPFTFNYSRTAMRLCRGRCLQHRLPARNNIIWDEWADENGDLGPVYGGKQWRAWPTPDGRHMYRSDRHDWQPAKTTRTLVIIVSAAGTSASWIKSGAGAVSRLFPVLCRRWENSPVSFISAAMCSLGLPFNVPATRYWLYDGAAGTTGRQRFCLDRRRRTCTATIWSRRTCN